MTRLLITCYCRAAELARDEIEIIYHTVKAKSDPTADTFFGRLERSKNPNNDGGAIIRSRHRQIVSLFLSYYNIPVLSRFWLK